MGRQHYDPDNYYHYYGGDRLDDFAQRRIPHRRLRHAAHNFGRNTSWTASARGGIVDPMLFCFAATIIVGLVLACFTPRESIASFKEVLSASWSITPEQTARQAARAARRNSTATTRRPLALSATGDDQPRPIKTDSDVIADQPMTEAEQANEAGAVSDQPTTTKTTRHTEW